VGIIFWCDEFSTTPVWCTIGLLALISKAIRHSSSYSHIGGMLYCPCSWLYQNCYAQMRFPSSKCTGIVFGWSYVPDPAWRAFDAPHRTHSRLASTISLSLGDYAHPQLAISSQFFFYKLNGQTVNLHQFYRCLKPKKRIFSFCGKT